MKKEILEQMSSIAESVMTSKRWAREDIENNMKALENYEGAFIWQIASTHARLTKCDTTTIAADMIENEATLYRYAQGLDWGACCISYKWSGERIFFYTGNRMVEISRDKAIEIYKRRVAVALAFVKANGIKIPTDFKVRVKFADADTYRYFVEQVRYAHEHNDDSLLGCSHIFHNWVKVGKNHEVTIYKDMWSERSFYFVESFGNGKNGINGGLIYHGYDEYKTNGSVQLESTRGWAMHT